MSEDTVFDAQYDKFSRYAKKRGFWAIWSIYDMKSWWDRPFRGTFKIRYRHWNGPPYSFSKVMVNPTWAVLYREANRVMLASKDQHHQFVEAFAVKANPDRIEKGYDYLDLTCGS